MTLAEVPVPEIGPGEALMETRAAGICGSDLLDWYAAKKAGAVAGHEVSGEIVAVGDGVKSFKVGDRIVPHHHAPCLACEACRRGRFVHCAEWRSSKLDPGGMAQRVRIPAGNLSRDTQKLPASLGWEEASFTEPLGTVVKAFRQGRFHHDDRLLVIGLGTAGQLAIRYARLLGARGIAGADGVASRREKAGESGAEELADASQESPAAAALRITRGRGFDFVFVGPGKSAVIAEALRAVAPGGTLLLFTMPAPGDPICRRRARPLLPRGADRPFLLLRTGRDEARADDADGATARRRRSHHPPASRSRRPPPPSPAPGTRTAR